MRRFLLFYILSIFIVLNVCAKSPHGDNFKLNCSQCHTTENWTVMKFSNFNHNKTKFPLVGQHKTVGCKKCHPTLEFSKAKRECFECHTDIHQGTVGQDCERCHTPNSWLVPNVKKIHQQKGFVLIGAHATADCNRCHTSASSLRFDNIRSDCYSCHKAQYDGTKDPNNHRTEKFSTDCETCHYMAGQTWSRIGRGFSHGFYPLTGGHNTDCFKCHTTKEYTTKLTTDCKVCHPDKVAIGRSALAAHSNSAKIGKYECSDCHGSSSWNSVRFKQHDSWFGIYSGNHKGKWDKCTDCHNNDISYQSNCKKCHD